MYHGNLTTSDVPVEGMYKYAVSIQAPDSLMLQADHRDWIDGRGPALLPELPSSPSPLPTAPPCLDHVAAPSTWDNSANQTDPPSLPSRQLIPPATTEAPDAGQTAPTTELVPSRSSHTPSFETSDSSTDHAVRLHKPQPTQAHAVILPRIETHVFLDIKLPSPS